jgi:hypothetical protein
LGVRSNGRETFRADETDFLTRFNYRSRLQLPALECVAELKREFSYREEPWNLEIPDPIPEFVHVSAETVEEMRPSRVPAERTLHWPSETSCHRDTPAARRHQLFLARLEEQNLLTINERLSQRLDIGGLHTAIGNLRKMAEAMALDANQIEQRYRDWLFTLAMPDIPVDSDADWREVHSLGPEWHGLARLGLRCASMGTSEAEVERLLREQMQVQGVHGVNYGTETLHVRLGLRHDRRH